MSLWSTGQLGCVSELGDTLTVSLAAQCVFGCSNTANTHNIGNDPSCKKTKDRVTREDTNTNTDADIDSNTNTDTCKLPTPPRKTRDRGRMEEGQT